MISTLLNYRLYTNDMARTLDRLEQQSQIERSRTYYSENIGKVSSVDEFLDDYKLYSYAMKAYGLEDQINAKGLMRKVLESDLTDTNSFANKLVDKRYQAFAKAFSFSEGTVSIQSESQTDLVTEAYTDRVSRSAPLAAAAAKSFETTFRSALAGRDIETFLSNRSSVEFALRAVGVSDPTLIATSTVRDALDSASTPAVGTPLADLKTRFTAIRTGAADAEKVLSNLVYDYNLRTGNGTSPQAAQANVDYFKAAIADPSKITSVETLTNDSRIFEFMKAAVGMTESYTADYVAGMIKSQSSIDAFRTTDANGQLIPTLANTKAQFQSLHDLFQFDPSPTAGSRPASTNTPYVSGGSFLSSTDPRNDLKTVLDGYMRNYKAAQTAADTRATATYEAEIAKVKTLGDLLQVDKNPLTGLTYDPVTGQANTQRTKLTYLLKAFDIDPDTVSLTKIRAVLTSDPSDPNSYVSKLKDDRFSKLASAFNFDESGNARSQRLVQSTAGVTETAQLYSASFGTNQSEAVKSLVKTATQAYVETMQSVYSLDGLLQSKASVTYALKAYGVENQNLSDADLRRILTSDLSDPDSFANRQTDKAVAKFAAAFNFETDGGVADSGSGLQSGRTLLATNNLYLLQTLEAQAGETSEGTRLALYFLRKAPEATTSYAILSDKALFQVVRTALGLPEGMTSMDIEKQAAILDDRLDLDSFSDPKALDKFVARFAAMYDLANTDASSSPILQLFGSSGSSNGILSLF